MIDPVTTEVVASRLRETAATMAYALYHRGYSPILRDRRRHRRPHRSGGA
jgi:N-methylhydantoinase B/oxoprolinase/acetone carboxylase alpha subunit